MPPSMPRKCYRDKEFELKLTILEKENEILRLRLAALEKRLIDLEQKAKKEN